MKIWTIQKAESWFSKQFRDNYYFADLNMDNFLNYGEEPYKWMLEQCRERIENFQGPVPIWAWIERPKIRSYMEGLWKHRPNWLLVYAEVPANRILLSDFELWHRPLNGGFIAPDDVEDISTPYRDTWDQIFNIGPKSEVQACVDRIYIHEIISTRRIVGRKLFPVDKKY